jgi:hypothetical protein
MARANGRKVAVSPYFYVPIEFRSTAQILLKNPGVRDELFIMPRVTLSTGVTFLTEGIRCA